MILDQNGKFKYPWTLCCDISAIRCHLDSECCGWKSVWWRNILLSQSGQKMILFLKVMELYVCVSLFNWYSGPSESVSHCIYGSNTIGSSWHVCVPATVVTSWHHTFFIFRYFSPLQYVRRLGKVNWTSPYFKILTYVCRSFLTMVVDDYSP